MILLFCVWLVIVMVVVVLALLQGPLSGNAAVTQQGLWAIQNLAVREDNKMLLVAAGACDGERVLPFCDLLNIPFLML